MSRGGKRPGAGRKIGYRSPAARTRQVNVKLTEDELKKARAIGEGNASVGLRVALNSYDIKGICDVVQRQYCGR